MNTVEKVCRLLPRPSAVPLPAPPYTGPAVDPRGGVALAVEDMRRHMTDEGWQLMAGLGHAGYRLAGYRLDVDEVDVEKILARTDPSTVVVQDKREWDLVSGDFREPRARFHGVQALARRPDLFKVTVLKDAQQRPGYHRESAEEIGCHAWIVYYHPAVVHHVAPYVRPRHLVRTWHTVDAHAVPPYSANKRAGCLLSGAVGPAYPLRSALVRHRANLPETTYLPHPGYHRKGNATPAFLQTLSRYKVAICTSSRYGYALRKIIEATACGCTVVTDLPADDVLPEIDGNLIRVDANSHPDLVTRFVRRALREYDPDRAADFARRARAWYDYRAVGRRLAEDLEALRRGYND